MKVITKMELRPGMILAEDIVNFGELLYSENTTIDEKMIEKLNRYPTIVCVTVKEDIDLASTHYERIRCDENFKVFEKAYNSALMEYKSTMFRFFKCGEFINDDFLMELYHKLYSLLPNGTILLDYLYNMMPNEDELTFTQCLNSALLGGTFADWLSMNEEAKRTMILCGFYYDVGKLQIPYNILWKPGRLDEQEFALIQNHPIVGHNMVSALGLNEHIKNVILMHHERMDGTGYPRQLSGNEIDIYARYFAIIDSYTAMASPRTYRSAFTPLQILGVFEQSMEKFDVELLLPLMKRIADAQIGSHVRLSDDTVWEVLIIHPNKFSRPILKNSKNEIIDLVDHPELEIVKNI